ncbi:uncharacterized protein LOC129737586 [Uranotaenia lowii]|uniref:uncharacterized protein LOC129737586 n=1 Tax=Uranotaenia lowii TaxID=190385 RepID=UPI0024798D48|nr:uncharacterized protein LOC129737586 [Uranotaenia lowii]
MNTVDKTECIGLELNLSGEKILVLCIYNPPDNDCSQFLSDKLEEYAIRYSCIILVGDFNTDLSRPSRKRSNLEDVFTNFSLSSVGVEPTFFHADGCSQLDLFVTSSNRNVLRFNQVSFPTLSHHDLIYGSLDIDTTIAPKVEMFRDYMRLDFRALENNIFCVPWNEFYEMDDPNQLITFFNNHLQLIHDRCIPLRKRKRRKVCNPWFNDEIAKAMLERDLSYRDWRFAPTANKALARSRFQQLRNKVNSLVFIAKRQFFANFLDSRLPSSILWKRLKTVGVGKERSTQICDLDPDEVNRTFLSNYVQNETDIHERRASRVSSNNFSFRSVQWWEVVNAIRDVKSNATGLDGLPIKFIKIILPFVVGQITHLFNQIIETSVFPTIWKHAKIIPLRKNPHLSSISNLRPISILCAISKAFEKLLKQQMSSFIAENELLSAHQAGFRKGHSIKTAALHVYDELARVMDKKGTAILVLLDFSKAFDTIPHDKLCHKLSTQFNFSDSAVTLIESYLVGRSQTVFCGEQQSGRGAVPSGVPQGSVIGPLLFCCHVNDLPGVLKYCSIQLYADDVQLHIGRLGPCGREIITMVNEDLKSIEEWSQQNQLLVNPTKSKALFLNGRRRNVTPLEAITLGDQVINWTESAQNLGFVFQTDLQWDKLINQQCAPPQEEDGCIS